MKSLALAFVFFLSFIGSLAYGAEISTPPQKTAYDFSFENIDGSPLKLSALKGKAVLIVNTASQCGFSSQFEGLETLYQTYKKRGFIVIGVPSDNFGQEPFDNNAIKDFTQKKFHTSFPLTQKVDVTGEKAHPFYVWAAAQNVGGFFGRKPMWNFHKYLLDRDGRLVGGYSPLTKPDSDQLKTDIENALKD